MRPGPSQDASLLYVMTPHSGTLEVRRAPMAEWLWVWGTLAVLKLWRREVVSWNGRGTIVQPGNWCCFLIRTCIVFQIPNLFRMLSSWGGINCRPSAPSLYEVASHVKSCHFGRRYCVVAHQGSGMRLGTHGHYYFESRLHSAVVNLIETRWQHLEGSTSPAGTLVPREEFMMALARLERLLVRAAFNVYQLEAV